MSESKGEGRVAALYVETKGAYAGLPGVCGWACEVWQSAYGHRANKATWLYYFGDALPPELRWERPTGTHQVGFHDQRGLARNKPTLSKKEANATPVEFRDALLAMARWASPERRVAA